MQKRNLVFATNSDFLIPVSMQPIPASASRSWSGARTSLSVLKTTNFPPKKSNFLQ